ncbi:MAG: hypothetical protein GY861_13920 [bacterium]|nr:hypothetical protein [bacterium]
MPFFFKNITTRQIAQQALDTTKQTSSILRRQDMQKRIDYFNDKQDAYLQQALYGQFEYPERLKLQREFFNVTNLMINELAVLYNEDPLREIKDGVDKDTELFDAITESTNLNNVLQTVNQYVKLMRTVLVKPEWSEQEESIVYRIFTPNMFDVIMDDHNPSKAKAIIYSKNYPDPSLAVYGNDDRRTKNDKFEDDDTIFHVWTDEQYFMFQYQFGKKPGDIEIKLLDNPANKDNINPYGTLDIFVPFRDCVPIDDFFPDGGDDILVANESINIKLTELNYLIKMQSFSIPVRKGGDSSSPVILDPSMTIDLPADDDMGKSDFKFVSPEAKIVEIQSEVEQKLRRLALKYKMNPDMFTASGNKSSSDSLQLQNYAQGRLIKKDKPYFRKNEVKLFDMTKLVNNTHNSAKFSENCSLFVDFRDSEMPMTQKDKDAHQLTLFNNGLISKAEWLLDENPDLGDIDTAKEKIAEIDEQKAVESEQAMERIQSNPLLLQKEGLEMPEGGIDPKDAPIAKKDDKKPNEK